MKNSIRKILIIEIIMFLVIVSTFFEPFLFDHHKYLIFLLSMGGVSAFLLGIDTIRTPNSKPILKNTLIFLLLYFLIAYLAGLFIGFAKTIYSWSMVNLVKNIIPALTVVLVSELVRYQLIKKSDNKIIIVVLSFLIFTLLDISIGFYNYDLSLKEELYEFIGLIAIGSVAKNILMTIYCIKGDYVDSIVYRLIMDIYIYIVPIVPNFGIYIDSVIVTVLPVVLSFMVINLKAKKIEKPKNKRKGLITFLIVLFILLTLVLLNSGFFKYQTLVIGSNSMKNYITKGDVIIMEKLNDKEKNKLEEGEILIFRYEGKLISHRIHKIIVKNNQRYYMTKGDNNNQPDAVLSTNKNAVGVARLKIEKIGLPSVWLSELFS